MNNYVKLVNFEVKRFSKFLMVLIASAVVIQIIGVVISSFEYVERANQIMKQEGTTVSDYLMNYGFYSFNNGSYPFFAFLSVTLVATVLGIYVLFIWYRDWLGKSTFIYRLLMLPTERRNVFFAKLTAILLFVLSLVSVQTILTSILIKISEWIVPETMRVSQASLLIYSSDIMSVLYPQTPLQFVFLYGIGISLVAVVFTAILFERSYHLKGIVLAIIYTIISFVIVITPLIIQAATSYFYFEEVLLLVVACSAIVLVAAIGIADYLLKYKINV